MNFERRMKKHIDSTLDGYTPNPYPKKRHFPTWAKIMIPVAATAVAVAIIVPIATGGQNMERFVSLLSGTHVDMDNVSAFCIWSAPEGNNTKPKLKSFAKIIKNEETSSSSEYESSYSWTEEEKEQYEWELDYDWDPQKANVLISMDDEGKVKEVVYERENNKGVVRQNTLGNAAAVFTSKSFTYVMYVSDSEWDFWKDVNYAQEIINPNGFHCHHEELQTVIIHNETGKVFVLKDLFPQVDKYSKGKNYTMQGVPTKDDFMFVHPMYGNLIPQYYDLIYDNGELHYDYILPDNSYLIDTFNWHHTFADVRRDKYGQRYVLINGGKGFDYRGDKDIVNLSKYEIYENTLVFFGDNQVLRGSDQRMYAFRNGVLKVFGENFKLAPVEKDLKVTFEGISGAMLDGNHVENDTGIVYHLEDNYLYSIFGDVYTVSDDGSYDKFTTLTGSLPTFADEGYLLNNCIIAFVDAENLQNNQYYSTYGELVQITFGLEGGVPAFKAEHIIDATSYRVYNDRLTLDQEEPSGIKEYVLKFENGKPVPDYVVYRNSSGIKLVKPITEPLTL